MAAGLFYRLRCAGRAASRSPLQIINARSRIININAHAWLLRSAGDILVRDVQVEGGLHASRLGICARDGGGTGGRHAQEKRRIKFSRQPSRSSCSSRHRG